MNAQLYCSLLGIENRVIQYVLASVLILDTCLDDGFSFYYQHGFLDKF